MPDGTMESAANQSPRLSTACCNLPGAVLSLNLDQDMIRRHLLGPSLACGERKTETSGSAGCENSTLATRTVGWNKARLFNSGNDPYEKSDMADSMPDIITSSSFHHRHPATDFGEVGLR